MNYNIETLNIDELKDFFEIDGALNSDIIIKKVNSFIIKANTIYSGNDKDMVIEFINKARDKLLGYCNNSLINNQYTSIVNTNKDIEKMKLETFDIKYKLGRINPLRKQTRILNLNINSLFRKNYYKTQASNYIYNFPTSIKNVVSMRVATFEFANSVHLYNAKNRDNEFTIITYDNSGGIMYNIKKHMIQVPDGMYALDTIIKYLNKSIFSTNISLRRVAAIFDDKAGTLNFIRNRNPSNSGIADPPNYELQFDIDFRLSNDKDRPIQLNMGWTLGYRKEYYKYSEDYVKISDMKIITQEGFNPEAPINLLGTPYFLLHINDYNNNCSPVYETLFQEGIITSSHIMDKIPNTGSKTIIQTNLGHNIDKIRRYYGPVNIEKVEIKLLDQFGRIVELKKSDFSLTLQFEILYNL